MEIQEQKLCLLNMPELVLNKILSNIHNPSDVSRTCKYLYDIVCGMEKARRVLYISAFDAASPLNIDTDAVLDSIMNSHRTIKEIELRVDRLTDDASYEVNERQLERMTAIMKQFGENITSLKFHQFVLPINFIIEMLKLAPKLESLSFTNGKVMGSVTENTTESLQLPSLRTLEINSFAGLSDIVNLIPVGSLNSICYTDKSTEVLTSILTRQHNTKSLHLQLFSPFDRMDICADDLQLEALTFNATVLDIHCVKLLKCQTNLKELRFLTCYLTGSLFQWICYNLKKLEVFEVHRVQSPIEGNPFEMLAELKQLKHFRTFVGDYLFNNGFQSFQFKSDSIEKFEILFEPKFSCGDPLNEMVNSMAHNFPNLTHLGLRLEDFSALCVLLRHCTKIIHLTCYISDPIPDQLNQQRFPNIQHLELCNYFYGKKMRQSMTSVVRAMPNLRSMSLSLESGLKFDINTMKAFIKNSKRLEYFYVNRFKLHRQLATDDVVNTIRCLTDQLKGYDIMFSPPTSPGDLNWHKIKENLSNECYVRDEYLTRNATGFSLHKGRNPYFS